MSLLYKMKKQFKDYQQKYDNVKKCEDCPVRTLAIHFEHEDPAKIDTCFYFISYKDFSNYFHLEHCTCENVRKRSLILAKEIGLNKI